MDSIDGFKVGDWITPTFGVDRPGRWCDKLVRIEPFEADPTRWAFWVDTGGYLCHPTHKIRHATQDELIATLDRRTADALRDVESDPGMRDLEKNESILVNKLKAELSRVGNVVGAAERILEQIEELRQAMKMKQRATKQPEGEPIYSPRGLIWRVSKDDGPFQCYPRAEKVHPLLTPEEAFVEGARICKIGLGDEQFYGEVLNREFAETIRVNCCGVKFYTSIDGLMLIEPAPKEV